MPKRQEYKNELFKPNISEFKFTIEAAQRGGDNIMGAPRRGSYVFDPPSINIVIEG